MLTTFIGLELMVLASSLLLIDHLNFDFICISSISAFKEGDVVSMAEVATRESCFVHECLSACSGRLGETDLHNCYVFILRC